MGRLRTYARNLTANWVGYVANLAVMFFLTPFVEATLGEELYGAWSILVTVTGYLGLVELGTRASLGRHVNFYLGKGDLDRARGVFNTALVFFAACGPVLLAVAAVVGVFFGDLFHDVSPDFLGEIRWALLLATLSLWMGLFSASFKQIVIAHERFDTVRTIDLVVLTFRAAGTWYVLSRGWGIVGLASLQLALSVVATCAMALAARTVQRDIHVALRSAGRDEFRELISFGVWAFLAATAMQILYLTDTVVVGALFDLAAVTTYAIPLMLVSYARGITAHISGTMTPRTIQSSGRGDLRDLRFLTSWGFRASMMIAVPLYMGFIFFGTEFLGLWMRPEFDNRLAGQVLILLAVPQLVSRSVDLTGSVINGLGYVRFAALMTGLQAAVNLGLSLLFAMVLGMGLHGIALGTLVPMVLFNVIMVACMLRWTEHRFADFFRNVLGRGLAAVALVSGLYWLATLLPEASRLLVFMGKATGLGVAAAVITFVVLFTRGEQRELIGRLAGAFRRHGRPTDQA